MYTHRRGAENPELAQKEVESSLSVHLCETSMFFASLRRKRRVIYFALFAFFASSSPFVHTQAFFHEQKRAPEKDFEIIEGVFHDGLGTFAELSLANRLIAIARISQQPFDLSRSEAKMRDAINRLPEGHRGRAVFERERANIVSAVDRGAALLLDRAKPASLARARHTAKEFAGAKAADLRLEFDDGSIRPISVKTEFEFSDITTRLMI